MVVKDTQPFSLLKDKGFRALLHPAYILPSRKALKAMVAKKHKEKVQAGVKKVAAVRHATCGHQLTLMRAWQ